MSRESQFETLIRRKRELVGLLDAAGVIRDGCVDDVHRIVGEFLDGYHARLDDKPPSRPIAPIRLPHAAPLFLIVGRAVAENFPDLEAIRETLELHPRLESVVQLVASVGKVERRTIGAAVEHATHRRGKTRSFKVPERLADAIVAALFVAGGSEKIAEERRLQLSKQRKI